MAGVGTVQNLNQQLRFPGLQPLYRSTLLGPLSLVSKSLDLPVTVQQIWDQCRIEESDDVEYVADLIRRACEYCEKEIDGHAQFITATYDVPTYCWWSGPLKLPRPPLASVTSIKYFDTTGTEQTLASTYYLVRTPWRQPGTIDRAPNQVWPSYQTDRTYPITIRFVAGHTAAVDIPHTVKHAIVLLASHWYENRSATDTLSVKEIELGVKALLNTENYGSYA